MLVTVKYNIEINECEMINAGEVVNLLEQEYKGFSVIRYNGNEYYCHAAYLNILQLSIV